MTSRFQKWVWYVSLQKEIPSHSRIDCNNAMRVNFLNLKFKIDLKYIYNIEKNFLSDLLI